MALMNGSMRHEFCCPVKPFPNETQRLGELPMGGIDNSFFFLGPVPIWKGTLYV